MSLKYLITALACVVAVRAGYPPLEQATIDLPEAFQTLANESSIGFQGQENFSNLFARQACRAGYGQCAYTGECCPANQGNTCCGRACIALQPQGTVCCNNYMCPPNWKCCGTGGTACYPVGGECCNAAGRYCPPEWSCCGARGCNPTQDYKCCAEDGTYCPKSNKCVYCRGSSTRVCCQGPDEDETPVFNTDRPTGGSGGGNIPDPTTAAQPTRDPTTAVTTRTTTTRREAVTEYYTTTYIYSYLIWTRIVLVSTTVSSTTVTRTTTLSVLATGSFDAGTSFRAMASSISSSASSNAREATRSWTSDPTTVRETVTRTAAGGGGGGSGGSVSGASGLSSSPMLFVILGAIVSLLLSF